MEQGSIRVYLLPLTLLFLYMSTISQSTVMILMKETLLHHNKGFSRLLVPCVNNMMQYIKELVIEFGLSILGQTAIDNTTSG